MPWIIALAAVCSVVFEFGVIKSYAVSGSIFQVLMGGVGGNPQITQPILSMTSSATGLSTSVPSYVSIGMSSAFAAYTSLVGTRRSPIAIPGTMTNLTANFVQGVGTGTWTVTIQKGTSSTSSTDTALTCTVSSGTSCSDTSDTVLFAAGDDVEIKITPNGSVPATNTNIQVSTSFTGQNLNEAFLFSPYSALVSTSVNEWQGFVSLQPTATNDAGVASMVSTSGTIDQLYVRTQPAPGAGKTYQLTVFKNGVATGITCTVSGTSPTCNDTNTSHAVSLAIGDTISIQIAPGGTPTAAALMASVRWVPDVAKEVPLFGVANATPTGNVAEFLSIAEASGISTSEAAAQALVPIGMTFKKLRVVRSSVPGGAASQLTQMRSGGVDAGALGCSITSATTLCTDNTDTYSPSVNSLVNWRVQGSGSPASYTYFRTGVVVTVP